MAIVLARIDNRLLHGVVATQWAPTSGCNRIMVVDDATANDPQKKEAMKFGRPAGVNLSIITEETAITNFKNHKYDGQKVFIITKEPETLVKIAEIEPLLKVNIGGTVQIKDGIKLSDRAYATKENIESYEKLIAKGSSVTLQYTPNDKVVAFESVKK